MSDINASIAGFLAAVVFIGVGVATLTIPDNGVIIFPILGISFIIAGIVIFIVSLKSAM